MLDDNGLFIVEKILKHEIINEYGKEKVNLLIKWFGYEKPELCGLNISLKRNEVVKEYLKANDMKQHLPKDHNNDQGKDEEVPKKKVRFT